MNRSDFNHPYTPSEYKTSSAPKRREKIKERTSKTLKIDRISELPDPILVHILTLLPDTESAIRTGILSKRWQFLWTSIPVLSFHFHHYKPKTISNFINFVDKTLIQCSYSKLKKLEIRIDWDDDEAFTSIDTWIRYALACNVEELKVGVSEIDEGDVYIPYEVPLDLFKSSSLSNLTLRYCVVPPRAQISWTMLKRFSIWYVVLTNDLLQDILLGSPMLESLELGYCYGCAQINIKSASLKELVLNDYHCAWAELEISGPNISSLEIKGDLSVSKLVLHSLQSLVKLCLDFYIGMTTLEDPNMWMKLFESITHVQDLTVGNFAMKVLSSLELDGWASPLSKRTVLRMKFCRRSYFPGLANLLQSSPFLESLLIDRPPGAPVYLSFYTRRNFLTCKKRTFHCLQKHLKFVKICYLFKYDQYHECELGRFVLENASVLEKMVISVGAFGSFDEQSRYESQRTIRLKVSEKYLSFPRASKKAVVLVEDLNTEFRHEWQCW